MPTITKETGAIVQGANSYVALSDADAYHTNRGNATWTGITAQATREQLLIKATQQFEARYRTRWKGKKRDDNPLVVPQPLAWPRSDVLDEDGVEVSDQAIPQLVQDALCEVALLLAGGSSLVQAEVKATDAWVTAESVGPISVSYGGKGTQLTSTFPMVDQMLQVLLAGASATSVGAYVSLTADEIEALERGTTIDLEDPDFFL